MPEDAGEAALAADRPYWIAFNHIPGIGPARFAALLHRFGTAAAAWRAPEPALAKALDARSRGALVAARRELSPERLAAGVARQGGTVLTWRDPGYPPRLRQLEQPPFLLYVRGEAALLAGRSVSVVGTRRPSAYGLRAARQIAGDLAAAGLVVVSGLARGIDGAAHEAALAQGQTVAVLGTGLDGCYPAAHRGLQGRIAAAGALATEYPPGSSPEPGNFPARNRVVAGLTLATVVVEAGAQSGALITARYALDFGREVLAVPGSIFEAESAGTNGLLGQGAAVCRSAADVLAALGFLTSEIGRPIRPPPPDALSSALLTALSAGPGHADELARATGLPAAEVARGLALLELGGFVVHLGGMRWAAA